MSFPLIDPESNSIHLNEPSKREPDFTPLPDKVGMLAQKILMGVCIVVGGGAVISAVLVTSAIAWIAVPCAIGAVLFDIWIQRIDAYNALVEECQQLSVSERLEKFPVEQLIEYHLFSKSDFEQQQDGLSFQGFNHRYPLAVLEKYPDIFTTDAVRHYWTQKTHDFDHDQLFCFCNRRLTDARWANARLELRHIAQQKARESVQTQSITYNLYGKDNDSFLTEHYGLNADQIVFMKAWKALDRKYDEEVRQVRQKVLPNNAVLESKCEVGQEQGVANPSAYRTRCTELRNQYWTSYCDLLPDDAANNTPPLFSSPQDVYCAICKARLFSKRSDHFLTVVRESSVSDLITDGVVTDQEFVQAFQQLSDEISRSKDTWSPSLKDVYNAMELAGLDLNFCKQLELVVQPSNEEFKS